MAADDPPGNPIHPLLIAVHQLGIRPPLPLPHLLDELLIRKRFHQRVSSRIVLLIRHSEQPDV
jgi:hypothetical protein